MKLMNFLACTIFSVFSSSSFAAEPTVGAEFRIEPGSLATYIVMPNVIKPRWYVVMYAGSPEATGQLTGAIVNVDGQASTASLSPSGQMLIYGKSIALQNVGAKVLSGGRWDLIDPVARSYPAVQWASTPASARLIQVASLDVKRDVVITFGPDLKPGECIPGKMYVYVDGGLLLDPKSNSVLVVHQRSSLVVKGRLINLKVEGKCEGNGQYFGTLQVLEPITSLPN